MTGERSVFLDLQPKEGGHVIFGGNQKRNVIGIGKIGGRSPLPFIPMFFWLNLFSISQLCNSGYNVFFIIMLV